MKKRIISLVVALCMILSLVPFTAFAESDIALFATELPLGTAKGALVLDDDASHYGVPILSVTDTGNIRQDLIKDNDCYYGVNWYYDVPQGQTTGTLYLSGNFDFSLQPYTSEVSKDITVVVKSGAQLKNATVHGDLIIEEGSTIENVSCKGKLTNNGTILGDGTFTGEVTNNGTISGGNFKNNVENNGLINGGTFDGKVDNTKDGTISDGTFNGDVDNKGTIEGGTFNGSVTNDGTIKNGNFTGDVKNDGTITGGNFKDPGKVDNNGTISGGNFDGKVDNNKDGVISDGTFTGDVKNDGTITGGNFKDPGKVDNNGTISGGNFDGKVDNNKDGVISDGTFTGDVKNDGTITGGDFKDPGNVDNNGIISGGNFDGKVDNNKDGVISDGTFTGDIKNGGTITGGNFKDPGKVDNNGTISGGTFDGKVDNNKDGTISDGTFTGDVKNDGTITGGDFKDADKVDNSGTISGGDFNGDKVDNHPGSTYEPTTDSATKPENPDKPSENPDKPSDNPSDKPSDDSSKTTYIVKIEGGTINGKTEWTANEGDELTARLDKSLIPDGMTFDAWEISSNKLTGDPTVALKSETMTFRMPAENVTIRALYRSAEIPGDDGTDDAARSSISPAGAVLLAATGTAATAVALWEGYQFLADSYLRLNLPEGTATPTSRRELVLLMWKTAGKPEVELADGRYSDIDPQDIELLKAAQWAEENQLMEVSNERNLTLFDPDNGVTNIQVFHAWRKLKKLLKVTDTAVVADAATVS